LSDEGPEDNNMNEKTESPSQMNQSVEASWNPFDPDFLINPYPHYELLRDNDPVHRTGFGNLVVTRFDDVSEVLRNPNTSVDRDNTAEGMDRPPSILTLDPPEHTRLRKLVQRTFTPRSIEKMRSTTSEIVEDLLDQLAEKKKSI